MGLTDEQQRILEHDMSDMYINAGPGSGKTFELTKISEKILSNPNNSIMLITFTNKAAKSILYKCKNLDISRIIGGTFHSISNTIFKNNGVQFNICDSNKQKIMIKNLFNCKKDAKKFREIIDNISNKKSQYPLDMNDYYVEKYQQELNKYNLVDFDDMILRFVDQCKNLSLPRITHVLVDELQDTSQPQLEMLKCIKNETKCSMIGASDEDQSLYVWRNARPKNIQDFVTEFKCKVFNMGYNFRSNKSIVTAANNVIVNNKYRMHKSLKAVSDKEGLVSVIDAPDSFSQSDIISSLCKRYSNNEIAIIYRNRIEKNKLEYVLKKNHINYTINDSLEVTDRSGVKSMVASLKLASGSFDSYDLIEASKALKGIGQGTVSKLIKSSKNIIETIDEKMESKASKYDSIKYIKNSYKDLEGKPLSKLCSKIEKVFIDSFSYGDDIKDFIIDITENYEATISSIREFSNDLGLDNEKVDEGLDEECNVHLSTIHSYKGLERDIVIMPWCEQYEPKFGKDYSVEDERRAFYVGLTRAKSKLYLTYSGSKPLFIKEMKVKGV